jgi:hypothetical protein
VKTRSRGLDVFRGIVIVDMVVVHFADFQSIAGFLVQAVDFAVEGFLFLAGFMIGWHYLPSFLRDNWAVTRALWSRAGKIVLIHYFMILTISLPFWSLFYLQSADQMLDFGVRSFLFLNQIPILHILPTFVPLFLLSPALLYLLSRSLDWLLPFGSLALFGLFVSHPNAVSIGENRIFPVILWQVYFVFGCFFGKRIWEGRLVVSNRILLLSCMLFGFCFILKYGSYFSIIRGWKETYDLYPKKFPLNWLGLFYGSTLLAFVFAIFRVVSNRMEIGNPVFAWFSVIGRQSLLVFVLHAYVIFAVKGILLLGASQLFAWITAAALLWGVFVLSKLIDRKGAEKTLPKPYTWLFN